MYGVLLVVKENKLAIESEKLVEIIDLRFQKITLAQWTALVQTPPFRAIKLTLSLVYLTSVRM